ncbi:hypothetical protein J4439_05405 [Candidatus Woesearchaeota archaeon]|nr:hypothetical protein [Candidatus Woesearchaeota archaeon]
MEGILERKDRERGLTAGSLSALLLVVLFILGAALVLPLLPLAWSQSFYDNTSIESRVNVTNAAPRVERVDLYGSVSGVGNPITLSEGITTLVYCNATVVDGNGYQDLNVSRVNATAWKNTLPYTSPDDNNNHYTNTSCRVFQVNLSTAQVNCAFNFEYYADNDSRWLCNLTVEDLDGARSSNTSVNTTVNTLLALNLTTLNSSMLLDFGNMAPGDTTTDANAQMVNITNTGNANITIAIDGWARNDSDGLAMNCTIGNISQDRLRYNFTGRTEPFANMFNLTDNQAPGFVPGLVVWQRVDDLDDAKFNSTNTTFWKLNVPFGTKGFCNGTVIFSARG